MSRVGSQPIPVPEGVNISQEGVQITVAGPKGNLSFDRHHDITVKEENSHLLVERPSDNKFHRSLHGTTRAIVANMIQGVTHGFTRELEINGIGYSAQLQGKRLKLALGFSHDIYFDPPDGIDIKAGRNSVTVSGIDKQLVGQVAAKIRSFRPPEPYKGKGVRYAGEYVRIKKGKTVGE